MDVCELIDGPFPGSKAYPAGIIDVLGITLKNHSCIAPGGDAGYENTLQYLRILVQ